MPRGKLLRHWRSEVLPLSLCRTSFGVPPPLRQRANDTDTQRRETGTRSTAARKCRASDGVSEDLFASRSTRWFAGFPSEVVVAAILHPENSSRFTRLWTRRSKIGVLALVGTVGLAALPSSQWWDILLLLATASLSIWGLWTSIFDFFNAINSR